MLGLRLVHVSKRGPSCQTLLGAVDNCMRQWRALFRKISNDRVSNPEIGDHYLIMMYAKYSQTFASEKNQRMRIHSKGCILVNGVGIYSTAYRITCIGKYNKIMFVPLLKMAPNIAQYILFTVFFLNLIKISLKCFSREFVQLTVTPVY